MVSFLNQYSNDIFRINLGSFFMDLYQLPDGNWKFNGNGKNFSEKELILLMDDAFYNYLNSYTLYDKKEYFRDHLNIILIIANHLFFKNNILENISKEYIMQLLMLSSKNNQEILYIRGAEPQRYIAEFKKYGMHTSFGEDILTKNNFPVQRFKYFDITNDIQCRDIKFFWFIEENLNNLTKSQHVIYSVIENNRIASIADVLNLIVMKLHVIKKKIKEN